MRIANLDGRAVIVTPTGAVDIASASSNVFGPDATDVFTRWDAFQDWVRGEAGVAAVTSAAPRPVDPSSLGTPVPRPPQVLALGVNYRDHADEAGIPAPDDLVVFTKFVSCLDAPNATVTLPSDDVDYETELVVVMGRGGHHISREDAWDHVAGLAIGQDYSERTIQRAGPVPQFSLGKSFPGFGPFGPYVITPDEFEDRDAIEFRAVLTGPGIDGELEVQHGNTEKMFFGVAETIHRLSKIVTLYPGDVIFTGTPAGVGLSRGILLREGHVLTSELVGFDTIRNDFVAG